MEKSISISVKRRSFVKALTGSAVMALLQPDSIFAGNRERLPNIVFIICDQMRGDALSCLGSPNARTPHLDKLAEKGVLFKNFFSNNPVCAPSRVSFFTGLYPHQHGKLTNPSGKFVESFDAWMPGYFRKQGYKVGWVGKNHTASKQVMQRMDSSTIRAREPFRQYNKFVPPCWHSDLYWPDEQCYPAMNTRDATKFVNESADTLFFLHVSYFDPHPPYMASSKYTIQYAGKDMVLPEYIDPAKLNSRLAKQARALHYDRIQDSDLKETLRYYYAAIEGGVDAQVGQLMDALEKKRLMDNTIIVFTSDHGDFMGEYRMVRKGMFHYDALVHIPFIIYAPGITGKGIKLDTMAQGVDLYPTLIELTGGRVPGTLPGRSLVSYLSGDKEDVPDATVFASAAYSDLPEDYFENPEPAYNPDSDVPFHTRVQNLTWKAERRTIMARTREWKLIVNETGENELYHMDGGYTEKENLIHDERYAEIRQKLLKKIMQQWDWQNSKI